MIRVRVDFAGISPILINPATEDLLYELFGGAGARKPRNMDVTPKEVAERKVIKDENGNVGIPVLYLFSCLVEAGRLVKLDAKRSISTRESTLLPSFLSIEEAFLPFNGSTGEWKIDMRRGRIPNDGTAVAIIRPRFDKWEFSAIFNIDEKEIAEDKIKQLVEKAGSSVGLGDFRPAKRGPFGRFKITKWEKVNGK